MRRRRVALLTLALLVAACGTQAARVGAPSPAPSSAQITASATPATFSASASPTPRPMNATTDVLYVRRQLSQTTDLGTDVIDVVDARTGQSGRRVVAGRVTDDGRLLVRTESAPGGTRTVVHVTDLATGAHVRSMTVDGDFASGASSVLATDGRWAVLSRTAGQVEGQWMSGFAVVDTIAGTIDATGDLGAGSPYQYLARSPDGRRLYLAIAGDGMMTVRAYDLATRSFAPDALGAWETYGNAYWTSFVGATPAGPRFSLHSRSDEVFVLALDPASGRTTRISLPGDQATGNFEKYLLWSVVPTPDGSTLYAINPALGVVDEIDATALAVRRTATFEVTRGDDAGLFARLHQLLFPVAEAKRYLRSGAVLASDGSTLYAIGTKGIVALDTRTLSTRTVWMGENGQMVGSLALSPDGARLYAVDDQSHEILIFDAHRGWTSLGAIDLSGWVDSIVRIDTP